MTRLRAVLPCLALAVGIALPGPGGEQARAGEEPVGTTVRVLTRNIYLGCALEPVMDAMLGGTPEDVVAAASGAWAQLHATDIETRAGALADEIAAEGPDLVGLQEAALWGVQFPSDAASATPRSARTVEYDFVKILLRALRERGLRYRAVCEQEGLDVEMPVVTEQGLADARFTDRDVILARNGVVTSRPRHGNFEAAVPLPGLTLLRSWTSVDARVGGARFRFISTHLEDGIEEAQLGQVAELLAGPAATDLPVVLAGDFNSDAVNGYSPAVRGAVLDGGFTDAWASVRPLDPGLTWGHDATLANPADAFTLRLDYVFTRGGATATDAELTGLSMAGGLWPSDHDGLAVTVELPRGRRP